MKLEKTIPTEGFPCLRLISPNHKWEMGIFPVLFGYRVGVGQVGSQCYSVNYCAGNNTLFLLELLWTVAQIMEALPESITPGELEALFPTYEVKPIDLDPCWEKLQALAINPPVIQAASDDRTS